MVVLNIYKVFWTLIYLKLPVSNNVSFVTDKYLEMD